MPGRSWPSLPAIVLFAISLAHGIPAVRAQADGRFIYPLDDTYIHMAMAKHLAEDGVWGMTRYEFSSSSSSPLWTALLAGVYALVGTRELTPLILNILAAAGLLLLGGRVLERWGVAPLPRAIALVGLVVAVPLPALVLMGMEHVLHLLLSLAFVAAAIEVLIDEREPSRPRVARLCVFGALLGASRYEGFFLIAVVCLLLAARQRLRLGISLGLVSLVPLAAFGAIAVANGALFLPNSLLLKAGGEDTAAWRVLLRLPHATDLELFRRTPALMLVLVLGGVGAAAMAWRRRTIWNPQVLAGVLVAAMMTLHAHFAFSSLFWVYRHDAYLLGVGIIAAAAMVAGMSQVTGITIAAGGLAAILALVAAPGEWWSSAETLVQSRANYLEHYRAAEFVAHHYPAGPIVVNDIGAVSYYTDARLLDLFGLGSVEPILIRRTHHGAYTADHVDAWTAPHHPAAAIVQLGWAFVPPRVPANWIKVAEVEIAPAAQTLGFFAMSADGALALRERVQTYYEPLAGDGSYRVTVF